MFIILGLKIPFQALWKKSEGKEFFSCSCLESSQDYSFCPYCGIKKRIRKVKVYKSFLTGQESNCQTTSSILEYLHERQLDLCDPNPKGYKDDPVYIYLKNPKCFFEITSGDDPQNILVAERYQEIESNLAQNFDPLLWERGTFGLWAFNIPSNDDSRKKFDPE